MTLKPCKSAIAPLTPNPGAPRGLSAPKTNAPIKYAKIA
jgi:hypothetical protein